MNIEKNIEELLYEHDCVIIPGFGGFIGSYSPARIHPVHHTFVPPSKALLFNVNLHQNDGLLAHHLAKGGKMNYEEAIHSIQAKVEEWQQSLEEKQSIPIGKIGELKTDNEGNIQFYQDHSINFLPESYGLTSFISPAIRRELGIVTTEIENSPRRIVPSYLKWAATLALPLGLAAYMGFYQFDKMRDFSANYSGIFYNGSQSVKPVPAAKKTFIVPVPHRATVISPATTWQSGALQETGERPFAIIVGAFRFPENAANYVLQLKNKGIQASVYDVSRTGLSRVCVGAYSTREEALAQLSIVRSGNFSSAWLLSK